MTSEEIQAEVDGWFKERPQRPIADFLVDVINRAVAVERTWIPVSERVPEQGQVVLFVRIDPKDEQKPIIALGYKVFDDAEDGVWRDIAYLGPFYTASHWMPLPELPAAIRGGEGGRQ